MREILFRGKTTEGKWVVGLPTRKHPLDKEINRIQLLDDYYENDITMFFCVKDVLPETVGQYTGLTDKNGKKIFEGDILEFSDRFVVVVWHTHLGCWDSNFLKFTNTENGRDDMSPLNWGYKSKVIGNIHDNPELLKGGE